MAHLVADLLEVWRFVHGASGVALSSDMKAIGLRRHGRIVAGMLYDKWTDSNVWMHVAIAPGIILSPHWLRYAFVYPFDEVGIERITVDVDEGNWLCRRVIERVGFRVEAVLAGAARHGSDLLLYRLVRDDCTLLRARRRRCADASMAVCEAAEV